MSPSLFNKDGTNQSTPGQASPAINPATQSQIDVSHDVMEISDDSENDENGLTLQARPSANTTSARAPRPRVPSSGTRARAPAAPFAPDAASSFKPTRQLKSPLQKCGVQMSASCCLNSVTV
ncbi:transcriptional regulator family: C2H2 zinc finger and Fungal Specific TF [Penicillium desertorum]|uniref:Transcriptional regulator family: C2H2 zinc finger and Fungal Specific TF n=1 Tax=Penicillium desertorum TaxID=1303715 RepID=A0A9W9WN30_9EURO|nr:transcriptional regulator family: C2H2 zinc finger and Fungal Specific TF [Penicillium desertorum]